MEYIFYLCLIIFEFDCVYVFIFIIIHSLNLASIFFFVSNMKSKSKKTLTKLIVRGFFACIFGPKFLVQNSVELQMCLPQQFCYTAVWYPFNDVYVPTRIYANTMWRAEPVRPQFHTNGMHNRVPIYPSYLSFREQFL